MRNETDEIKAAIEVEPLKPEGAVIAHVANKMMGDDVDAPEDGSAGYFAGCSARELNGALLIPADAVPLENRCREPGCRKRWPPRRR